MHPLAVQPFRSASQVHSIRRVLVLGAVGYKFGARLVRFRDLEAQVGTLGFLERPSSRLGPVWGPLALLSPRLVARGSLVWLPVD